MLRDVITSKWLLGSFLFTVIFSIGCFLWSQNEERKIKKQQAEFSSFIQQMKNEKSETPTPTDEQKGSIIVDTPEIIEPLPDTVEIDTFSETLQEISEKEMVDEKVSPFGFGSYPKIPDDYPKSMSPVWTWSEDRRRTWESQPDRLRNFELIDRVLIKLWEQGERDFAGGTLRNNNGRVYPLYFNTAYVSYRELVKLDGTVYRYIGGFLRGPGFPRLTHKERMSGNFVLPPDARILDMDEAGIDPYSFLNVK